LKKPLSVNILPLFRRFQELQVSQANMSFLSIPPIHFAVDFFYNNLMRMSLKILFLLLALAPTSLISYGQNQLESYRKMQEMEESSIFRNLPWNQCGPAFQGGRVETIECPVGQPNVIYAGFGSGSLWKSTDHGLSWNCIFHDQATFSIGDVAVSQSNPDIIYLGTGENLRATRGYTYPGSGIYKSVDAGNSWKNVGLPDSHHIGRVVIDPNNPDLVFVAAMGHMWSPNEERGLFLSTDGGTSWKKSLYISDSVGVVDVVWDPANKIIYAAAWEMIQGRSSGIFKSADLGKHWEKCLSGFPENNGIGRIGLSLSSANPKVVYASLDNRNKRHLAGDSEIIGMEVYRSENSGMTWKKMNLNYSDNYSGFGWAFGDIRVSPDDFREIYVLGVHPAFSNDGGQTFRAIGGRISHLQPSTAETLHLDNHDLYIDPNNSDRLILGNDGGIYFSYDKGVSWLHCNNIPVAEVYDLKITSQTNSTVYAGTQDNASIYGRLKLGIPLPDGSEWKYVWLDPWSGGDGFVTMPNPSVRGSVFYESQNGFLNRKNIETGETVFIQPKTESDESPMRTSWMTPYFVSLHQQSTLYYGANKVYKSVDQGNSWYRISPDLCYPKDLFRKSRSLTSLAESPLKPGLLYAGTEKGALWISRDDGINWNEISGNLPNRSVSQICPSLHSEGRVYAVLKAVDEDDYKPYLYISEKKSDTWKLISTGLPEDRINCILEDPELISLIYIGTDRGLFLSPDQGLTWIAISNRLTTASVQTLTFAEGNNYLIAGTHGQSLFSCFVLPLRMYFKTVDPRKAGMLAVQPGYLPVSKDFSGDLDWSKSIPVQVYWNQPSSGLVSVIVEDSSDKQIYSSKISATSGLNVWNWDLVISKKDDSGIYPIPEYKIPAPGTYQVTVQGQGFLLRSSLEVR
jgi:photosystem II stability/assembly factor-like uncharacterized protein